MVFTGNALRLYREALAGSVLGDFRYPALDYVTLYLKLSHSLVVMIQDLESGDLGSIPRECSNSFPFFLIFFININFILKIIRWFSI